MEEKEVQITKKPWPSRLANSALEFVIIGIIICILGVILSGAGGGIVLTLGFGLITSGFLFSIFSFFGLISRRFKSPGIGKVILVVILSYPIFALVFAIVSPGLSSAKAQAHKIQCSSNLKMLSLACQMYRMDIEEKLLLSNWADTLMPYYEDKRILQCPADTVGPRSYAMNENIQADANELPHDLVLLFECLPGWNQVGGADDVVIDRHKRPGANIAFADGHVEFVIPEDIPNLRWTVDEQKPGTAVTR